MHMVFYLGFRLFFQGRGLSICSVAAWSGLFMDGLLGDERRKAG